MVSVVNVDALLNFAVYMTIVYFVEFVGVITIFIVAYEYMDAVMFFVTNVLQNLL